MQRIPTRYFLISIFIFICSNLATMAQDTLLYPSLSPGIKAPGFNGKNEKGKAVSLDKVKARITLLYFYEVHCHLCETITPQLKVLFDSYRKHGLEVIAIPTESGREDWLNYISEQGLDWSNIFLSPKNRDKIRSDYKLTVSPTIYLLDRNKILLTQRLWNIAQVEEELNRRIR